MEYKLISECGEREINEDCVRAASYGSLHCFVLCDGLGGHGKGDAASKLTADTLLKFFEAHPVPKAETLAQAFELAQSQLLHEQAEQNMRNAMKTTAVALLMNGNETVWAHIGDSRLYLFRWNRIACRTLDHSVPQMLAMMGSIKEKQIRSHPDRNRLLRVMGTEWGAQKYEISKPRKLRKCQAFLLCSDGFWEYITEKTMCTLLRKSRSAEEWTEKMLEEVRHNGSGKNMDNYSAIAIFP